MVQVARVPALPENSRLGILLGGLALALFVSLASVFGAEMLSSSYRTPQEVISYLNLPVLASIPHSSSAAVNRNSRRTKELFRRQRSVVDPDESLLCSVTFSVFESSHSGSPPDERFLYLSETHREALASLTYRLQAGRGFVGVVAPPGMGKTTLLFRLLQDLRGTARTAFIFQTQCTPIEFMRFLVEELELGADDGDLVHLHQLLKKALLKEPIVIVIDEAQDLSNDVLELVRLISNFETPRAKLLQIVLSGQPQLATKLAHPDLLQLRQRLSIIRGLQPFSAAHTAQYIEHRLKIAGRSGASMFSRRATEDIARLSGGVPRLINNICFNALSVGFASRLQFIDIAQVREGAADLGLTAQATMQPKTASTSPLANYPAKSPPQTCRQLKLVKFVQQLRQFGGSPARARQCCTRRSLN